MTDQVATRTRPTERGASEAVDVVVVVGGGAIGLGIAWRAALAGLRVVVVDDAPGQGASWAAAGMLAPVTEIHYGEQELLRLNLAAAERWPTFAAELQEYAGASVGYRRCGTLIVARDADDNAALDDLYRFQRGLGLHVERLRGRECRRLEPGLSPSIRGGIMAPGDHQVDNRALVAALLTACDRAGVLRRSGRVVAGRVEHDRVRGVVLAGGETLDASTVVLAAGCWSGTLGGLPPGALPPVRPVKGQLLHLRGPAEQPLCQRNVRGLEVYVVPRDDGRVVVGATVEEQGFNTTVTAGAVHDLLRAALELLPEVAELELVETVAGLRPGSPDNAPLLGPSQLDGLVIAAGHYRNGILLTPVTADAVAELLVTGLVPEAIAAFSPRRFATLTVPDGAASWSPTVAQGGPAGAGALGGQAGAVEASLMEADVPPTATGFHGGERGRPP
ncbi:MAG TPA: glycine oxidase ThiO [Actinomycetes bacterium]|nr:glycine oxidase ThiO [Actinomycetes bacterium]